MSGRHHATFLAVLCGTILGWESQCQVYNQCTLQVPYLSKQRDLLGLAFPRSGSHAVVTVYRGACVAAVAH